MMSPGRTDSIGIMVSTPLRTTRACLAPSSSNRLMAWEALPLALASKNLPNRMNETIRAAVSKNTFSSANTAQTE